MSSVIELAKKFINPPQKRTVMIAGPFRSGTNLMKFYLTKHSSADVVFSKWFWKHGVPPTTDPLAVPSGVPIGIMARDPVQMNISLYKFWKKRRPELDIGNSISDFIRMPLITYDISGGRDRPHYIFPSPTEYWNQYYYSWINWKQIDTRRKFIRIEELHESPDEVVTSFLNFAELKVLAKPIVPPDFYLSTSSDGEQVTAAKGGLVEGTRELVSLSPEDRDEIVNKVNTKVAAQLGYTSFS